MRLQHIIKLLLAQVQMFTPKYHSIRIRVLWNRNIRISITHVLTIPLQDTNPSKFICERIHLILTTE